MKKTYAVWIVAIVATVAASCAVDAAGQGLFGTISGVVTDSTGAVVSGAAVKVTNIYTGVATTANTNAL